MHTFQLLEPTSLDDAFALLEEHGEDAKIKSGGTALILLMKQRLLNPDYLIDLSKIDGLEAIAWSETDGLTIGGRATHTSVETHPVVRERYPALYSTMHRVAQPRVRNVGTLGGNLCHADPMQDPGSTLIALGASVTLRSAAGERTMPLEEFFVDYYTTAIEPNEILTAIHVPAPKPNQGVAQIKFTPRSYEDYATVGVAVAVETDGPGSGTLREVRIAFNSAAPTIFRALAAEDVLRGQTVTDELLAEAGDAAAAESDPTADIRGSAEYKRQMVKVFTKRGVQAALAAVR